MTTLTMEAPVAPAVKTSRFETRPCSRCGGSGTFSHCSFYGDTCFKCGGTPHVPGSGFALTKAGLAAREAWLAANTRVVRADEVKAGDRVSEARGRWTVARVEVKPEGERYGRSSSDGGKTWTDSTVALIRTRADGTDVHFCVPADHEVTLWTGAVEPPPAMEAGLDRAREMRAYIKAVAS